MVAPITQATAKAFIARHHRHNDPSITAVFCVGLKHEEELVGAAMAGLPKARMLNDGVTLEITRVCVLEGHRNANSMLYGACARAAKALGYQRLLTYTLTSETGASLKAAGWTADSIRAGTKNGWHRPNLAHLPNRSSPHPNEIDLFGCPLARVPIGDKIRWWKQL